MADPLEKEIPIPGKKEGINRDIKEKEEKGSVEEARQLYDQAKERLLNVNNWGKICGTGSAVFMVTDESGKEGQGSPKPGYHFKIDIPGPGTKKGHGYDWVVVETIEENRNEAEDFEYILMRVRPSDNPVSPNEEVAHFFSDKSTSNFLVYREGKEVTAAVLGRNEVPNAKDNASLLDKIRNTLVGIGAAAGFSNPQWKSLVRALLGKK